MKAYPLLQRNRAAYIIVLFICLGALSSSYAEQEKKVESIQAQIKSKNLEQWFKFYVPFFNPTEAQLQEKLKNDPKSSLYYHPENFNTIIPGPGQGLDTSQANIPSDQVPSGKPKDAWVAVVIPKGMSLPESPANTQGVQSQEISQPQEQTAQIQEGSFQMSAPVNTNGNLIQLPTPEKNYAGVWTGQYNKLIEYFDKATESWKASENSLRDVPVELNFNSNGQLAYKMPEREGSATFSARKGYLSIICPDVRVRGDYEVFQKDSTLLMRTSRVLVKDKMRVSLEFKLASKT
jgi:hypothetical protein